MKTFSLILSCCALLGAMSLAGCKSDEGTMTKQEEQDFKGKQPTPEMIAKFKAQSQAKMQGGSPAQKGP
jgi:outer membrane protein assembly factor BamE (lipoprotein component of BamABCDE complex)